MNTSRYNNRIPRRRGRRMWNYVSNSPESASRPNPPLQPETDFEQYFSGLFSEYISTKLRALIVGFTSMLALNGGDALDGAVLIWVIFNGVFGFFFYLILCYGKTTQHKTGAFLRWLQCVAIIIFLLSLRIIHNKSLNLASAVLYIVSYAISISHNFMTSKFIHIYITKIKKVALLMKTCGVLQLIIVLIQINLSNPITWFTAFFPLYILAFILFFCTIVLIKNAFITHRTRTQFWITEASNKKKGIAFILANLIVLQAILLYGTIQASSILDDNSSQYFRPFLPLCISIILFCLDLLLFGKKGGGLNAFGEGVKEGVLKVFEGLASLSAAGETHASEERYVIKISNTYFKIATKKDIKQLKSKKASAVPGDSEVEAGPRPRRMTIEMGMCMICCKEMSDGVFMGCGHGGICFECGKRMINIGKECHMCREKIKSILKVEIDTKKVLYKVLDETKCESL